MLPSKDELVICFAHIAYRLQERFSALDTGIGSFAVRDPQSLEQRLGEADVLVISGLWQNSLLDRARKLRFIQSIGAGTDQFPRDELAMRGIRLGRRPLFRHLKTVRKPSLALWGEHDEFCYDDVSGCVSTVSKVVGPNFELGIVADADHGFGGKEGELGSLIAEWL